MPGTGLSRQITIRNIAEIARVSIGTVSYVVNHMGCVSKTTRLKVESAIHSTKWKPNINARKLCDVHRILKSMGTDNKC